MKNYSTIIMLLQSNYSNLFVSRILKFYTCLLLPAYRKKQRVTI